MAVLSDFKSRMADRALVGNLPHNQCIQLTAKSVVPFAVTKAPPLLAATDAVVRQI